MGLRPLVHELPERRMLSFKWGVEQLELCNPICPELAVILARMAIRIYIPEIHFMEEPCRFDDAWLGCFIFDTFIQEVYLSPLRNAFQQMAECMRYVVIEEFIPCFSHYDIGLDGGQRLFLRHPEHRFDFI